MADPLTLIARICDEQPHNALTMIANVLGFTEERMQELERDAARYRWLRDKSEPNLCAFYLSVGMALHGVKFKPETVDQAIDAAMQAESRTDGVPVAGKNQP